VFIALTRSNLFKKLKSGKFVLDERALGDAEKDREKESVQA